MSKKYTEKDIQVLTDREHVRLRLPVYAGNTSAMNYQIPLFIDNKLQIKDISFVPATYKCVGEILDNCIDELTQTSMKNKNLTIEANAALGMYSISDNGRGVPIGKHSSGKYTPEVVFGSLRSGRNFSSDKQAGVIGMNGMGSSITCFCSTEFKVDVHRDKKRYRQVFKDGANVISKPVISRTGKNDTGTTISFELDQDVFDDTSLPNELIQNRAIEIALCNPGIITEYNKTKYKFKNGFDDIIKKISSDYFKFESDGLEFYVIFDINEQIDEQVFSWVNSSYLFDGGICNTQFTNAFYDKTIGSLNKEAKKNKCVITKNDIRQNLLVIGNLCVSDPEYDAQSKTRLTGPNLRKNMGSMVDSCWAAFSRKNKKWLDSVVERAVLRHHSSANKKAIKDHTKNLHKKVPGLIDATGKDRASCQILITEGLSAASMITEAREPKNTASLPLTGKINNVYGATVAQLLSMSKVTDLLTAIGLVPGQKAMRSQLRYGKIVIATDADPDGGDIFAILINLFYQFWPELFDPDYEPIVYRLIAPNVCVYKNKKRIHFPNRETYEKQKRKYDGWSVNYYKGLGSMIGKDWEMILSGDSDTLIPIIDDGNLNNTMKLLFGPDADARKRWLLCK